MTINFSNMKIARLAGLLYLIVVLSAIFSLAYVPKTLIDWENANNTFNNIVNHEMLFRLGIFSSVICYTAFIFLPVVLYKLLKPINEFYAKLMTILAFISVPISFVNLQNKLSILSLISNNDFLKVYTSEQLQTKLMLELHQYHNGILLVSVFWGLWLFPLGYLIFKSDFLPKILGILLMLGCIGYLINFTGNMLLRDYSEIGISKFISLPASIGEIGTCLWLLIKGVKK